MLIASTSSPVHPRLQTYRCVAVNRRFGPRPEVAARIRSYEAFNDEAFHKEHAKLSLSLRYVCELLIEPDKLAFPLGIVG